MLVLNQAVSGQLYTIQIGPPIGLDGDNGDTFVHTFWVRNESDGPLYNFRLEEISDELSAVEYSINGSDYNDIVEIGDMGVGQIITVYVKIHIPAGVNAQTYHAQAKFVSDNGLYEWNLNFYYNVISNKTYISQERKVRIGSMTLPSGFTSDSKSSEFQENVTESASGNVHAGERYRKEDRKVELVITDEPSQEKTVIENILPDGDVIELKRNSANIYTVDNANGIIYELYPHSHTSSINPNAPKFRRASVAYKSDGTQVRYHEPRIVDVQRVYYVDSNFSNGVIDGLEGGSGTLKLTSYSAWLDSNGKDETFGLDETQQYDDTQDASVFWNDWFGTNTTGYGVDPDGDGVVRGYRIMPAVDLSVVDVGMFSKIWWQENLPSGTSITVEVSLDGGQIWQVVENGGSIPGILNSDLTGKSILVRQTLATIDQSVTPELTQLSFDIQGRMTQGILIEEGTTNLLTTASSPASEVVTVTEGQKYTASAIGGTLTVYQRHVTSTTSDWQSGTLTDVEVV